MAWKKRVKQMHCENPHGSHSMELVLVEVWPGPEIVVVGYNHGPVRSIMCTLHAGKDDDNYSPLMLTGGSSPDAPAFP